ncbi:uncharacterized protein BJ171DRAFT_478144 [Polychytrium aggregatum]|uniref:uncharacterized protein n=1 Tax=Polychytrium aggregatum TaxID=110093 RepID=UPI0022FEBD44|nr:uncharacterized protein BJ171DRAFT_478144 [Polychytrium aggregatum]KAI9197206.1 hypothetical protein BJ171DRAFT_478144 [Polychytrium aggregatum]
MFGVDETNVAKRWRGPEGETLLHTAVLFIGDDKGHHTDHPDIPFDNINQHEHDHPNRHRDVARYLVHRFKNQLVNAYYNKKRYYGETALHLAVVKNDLHMTKLLVENGACVNHSEATGYEFRADTDNNRKKDTGKTGFMYYGGTVLSFAAVSGHTEIVKYLLSLPEGQRADPCRQDKQLGNTVLHVLAYWGLYSDSKSKTESCWHAISHFCNENVEHTKHPLKIRNNEGLTPFLVGIDRGHREALEVAKIPLWEFGMCSSYMFPVSEIDTWRDPNASPSEQETISALEIAVRNNDAQLLMHPMMSLVLRVKWEQFAKRLFLADMILHMFMVVCLSVSLALLPTQHADWSNYDFTSAISVTRLVFECLVIFSTFLILVREILEWFAEGTKEYWAGNGWEENIMSWIIIFFVTLITVLRPITVGSPDLDRQIDTIGAGLLAFSAWISILFFSKGFSKLGTLVVIFWRCLTTDLVNWVTIYAVIFMAFANIFFLQFKAADGTLATTSWGSSDYGISLMTIFGYLFGQGSPAADFQTIENRTYSLFVYFVYQTLTAILLLNVLIAMLNNSFSQIYEDSEIQWHLQWANLVLQQDSRLLSISTEGAKSARFSFYTFLQHALGIKPKARLGTCVPVPRPGGVIDQSNTDYYFIVRERKNQSIGEDGSITVESKPVKVIISHEEYQVPPSAIDIWGNWSLADSNIEEQTEDADEQSLEETLQGDYRRELAIDFPINEKPAGDFV